jgi:hypothetical protein
VRKPRAGEGGQILILSLLVVVLLTTALLLIAAALEARMKAVRREAAAVRLTALADAALAETLARLSPPPEGSPSPAISTETLRLNRAHRG